MIFQCSSIFILGTSPESKRVLCFWHPAEGQYPHLKLLTLQNGANNPSLRLILSSDPRSTKGLLFETLRVQLRPESVLLPRGEEKDTSKPPTNLPNRMKRFETLDKVRLTRL